MSFYGGKKVTWKIVYFLPTNQWNNGNRGVALIEAGDQHHAMSQFRQQYAGQFSAIETCERLLG
jgi:hypothetical protein